MIMLLYISFSSFVKVDYEILSEYHDVIKYRYDNRKNLLSHFLNQLKLLLWLTFNIHRVNTIYIWFADYHSFLPTLFAKLFKKKVFLVLGGYDVTFVREHNYGSFNNPLRAFCAKFSIKFATLNLAVSDNIKADALTLVPEANVDVVYTGYSPLKFSFQEEKEYAVMSVCEADTLQRAYIKGVDLIFETAKLLPDIKFKIVALNEKLSRENFEVPGNIDFIEHIPQEQLIELYKNNSVYIQLSLREGLPNSVCEAMLCGCIPVGTDAGGIPIAIGETGYLSKERDPVEISELIKMALKSDSAKRKMAKQRIINNFSLELRKRRINQIIDNYEDI